MVQSDAPLQPELLKTGDSDASRPVRIDDLSFARLLERLREDRGLSKADLAKRARFDPSSITRFEQGNRAPERDTILQLADAMVLPARDRDRLLASAGFRSELWDDPLLVEMSQLLADETISLNARREVRSVVRMGIAFLKLQRMQDSGGSGDV